MLTGTVVGYKQAIEEFEKKLIKIEMNSNKFRKELTKIMPGYKWTVHHKKCKSSDYISATGIQTDGFNRISTLEVEKYNKDGEFNYEVKSSVFGLKAPWLDEHAAGTLARALRGLQVHYENMASEYNSHAECLQVGRLKNEAKKI